MIYLQEIELKHITKQYIKMLTDSLLQNKKYQYKAFMSASSALNWLNMWQPANVITITVDSAGWYYVWYAEIE